VTRALVRRGSATSSALATFVALVVACGGRVGVSTPEADTASVPDTLAASEVVAEDTGGEDSAAADTALPADTTPTASGEVGAPCVVAADCQGGAHARCLDLQGGYCALDCGAGGATCPSGSACYEFSDGDNLCIEGCKKDTQCRTDEGYICDVDGTCWWYDPGPTGTSPVGGACARDEDCADPGGYCYLEGYDGNANGWLGGYCFVLDCTATSCPAGSRCVAVGSNGEKGCVASCADGAPCPRDVGYACTPDDQLCWPSCSRDADCPAGYGCSDEVGGCVRDLNHDPFVCADTRFEPNESRAAATAAALPLSLTGLDLCAGDEDWYAVTVPPGKLGTLGISFGHVNGDLDLLAYDASGAFVDSRVGLENYGALDRDFESSVEFYSLLAFAQPVSGTFRVRGHGAATNHYALETRVTDWADGLLCTDHFGVDECRGYDGTAHGRLYDFPFPSADDPYVPDGYHLETYGNYRWLRRELIMLVRYAIHEVQQRFPGADRVGLIDMCDKDGVTPGYDIGAPRHPETTHDQGGNIDIAYYQTDGDSSGDVVCGPNGSDSDGEYCTSVARTVMDVEKQTYFMAQLAKHPRLRAIGIDTLLAGLIKAEAQRQRDLGWFSSEVYERLVGSLAYGDGWPYHQHHIHVSMRWWGDDGLLSNALVARPEPAIGCGYRLPGDTPWPAPGDAKRRSRP